MGAIIVLVILGPIITWSGYRLIKKSNSVKSWHQTEVVLTKKGAKYTSQSTTSRSAKYELDVEYTFTIEGRDYTSNSYSHVTVLATEKATLKKAKKLPQRMTAYINPEKPEESYLVAPSMILAYIITGIGLLFILILLALIIVKM